MIMSDDGKNREPMLDMYLFEGNQLVEQLEEIIIKLEGRNYRLSTSNSFLKNTTGKNGIFAWTAELAYNWYPWTLKPMQSSYLL